MPRPVSVAGRGFGIHLFNYLIEQGFISALFTTFGEKLSEKPRRRPRCSPVGRQGGFSLHFGLLLPPESTVGAVLIPLFGRFRR